MEILAFITGVMILTYFVKRYYDAKKENTFIAEYYSSMILNGVEYKLHHNPLTESYVTRIFEIINDSIYIISSSKNLETIASRYDVIGSNLQRLGNYSVDSKELTAFESSLRKITKRLIKGQYFKAIKESLIKSKNAKTKRGRISPIEKILTVMELNKEVLDIKVFEEITDKLNYASDFIEAQDLYDKYMKFKFKGNTKKAQEAKMDLEYFLQTAHPEVQNIDISSTSPFEEDQLLSNAF